MHSILSWYLSGTPKATPEHFLVTAEHLLKTVAAERGLPFPTALSLKRLAEVPSEVLEGAEGILRIICTADRAHHYTALSISNRDPDTAWTLECILWQQKDAPSDSGFRITLRRKAPEQEVTLARRLPEWLVSEGLAVKKPHATLPLLTINTAVLPQAELPWEYRFLCRTEQIQSASLPPYQMESPLLPHRLEYRFADQTGAIPQPIPDVTAVLLPHAPAEGTLPEEVAYALTQLAEEAIRRLPCPDFAAVSHLLRHRDNSSAVSVAVTKALADRLRQARRANGLTQGDLSELTERFAKSPEQASGGLLISRIETMRLHRIETEKLLLIAKCLGLDERELLCLSDRGEGEPAVPNLQAPSKSPTPPNGRIHFCWACGNKRPSLDGTFCTFCGQKLQ